MVTIKDVAKYAGVSYSTVSRALADSSLVDAKTKKKVLRAAEEMHYVPNQMARSLKGGKSRTVLLIVPDLTNAFFPKMVTCFEENLRKHDYSILLGISDNTEEQENRCFERASSFGAEGIVWIACDENQERISNLIRSTDAPVILINREMDVDAACVTNDNRRGACAAVECLLQNGHRRVACLIRDVNQQHFKERYLGCQDAFRKYGISDEEVTYLCAENTGTAYEEACRLLAAPNRPTAFFVFSDWLADSVYSAAASLGLSIPQDVSVVGYDDIDRAQYMLPALTTWHHPIEQIATVSVDILMRQIDGDTATRGNHIVVPGRLVERNSVRDLTKQDNEPAPVVPG